MPRVLARSLLLAAAVSVLVMPVPALGHAAFVSATPGPGDVVTQPVTELILTFSQNLDPSRTSVELRDPSGARVARGGEQTGKREWRLPVPALAPGTYQVRWTTFSAEDGELARDRYSFTVEAAAEPSPTPTPQPPSAAPSATTSPGATSSPDVTTAPSPSSARPSPAATESVATPPPAAPAGDSAGLSVLLPILVVLVLLAVVGIRFLRRGRA